MPVSEAIQQAFLNSCLDGMFEEAGNSFKMLLYNGGVELSGNGYARQTITGIPRASEEDDNGYCTTTLEPSEPFTAVGGDLTWDQIEIRNSDASIVIFPKVYSYGTILSGENRKVTAVFGIPKPPYATSQTEIQNLINTEKEHLTPIQIAGGDIELTSAIDFTNTTGNTRVGGRLSGQGRGEPYALEQPNRGNFTNLVVPDGKTSEQSAILYRSLYKIISGLLISGKYITQGSGTQKLPIGLDMRWKTGGVGKLTAEDLFFYWCGIGIRLAKDVDEANCDEPSWTGINFRDCDICVQMNSVQTMGHSFKDIYVGSSPVVFDIHGGGNIKIDNILIQDSETDILHYRADTPNQFGPNNSGFKVENLKLDSQAVDSRLVIQDLNNGYYHKTVFELPQFPLVEWTRPAFQLSGRSNVTINNACNFQADLLTWQSSWNDVVPRFYLRNSTIWPYDSEINTTTDTAKLFNRILNQSTGYCDIKVENCTVYQDLGGGNIIQRELDDWSGRLQGTM